MNIVGDGELKDVSCSVKFWWTPCDIGTGTGAVGVCWVYRRGRNACGEGARGERRVRVERKVGGGGEESEGGVRSKRGGEEEGEDRRKVGSKRAGVQAKS